MKTATTRERLLASTFICGAAALTLGLSPAYAQAGAQGTPVTPRDQPAPVAGVAQPNSDDRNQNTPDEAEAQDEVQPTEGSEVEAVVVTGSRIRRDPTNAPTPLIQLNREEVIQSGEANVVDYLADIPALSDSQVPEDTTGASLGAGGLSLLSLRRLGVQRTLVLVDGRRHPGAAYYAPSAVDIDTIPRLLIENIEIITGGSSAIYGADAVAGVVNFILRRDFEGLEVDTSYAQINQDGQSSQRVSALIGHNFLDNRLNLYATAEWDRQDEVFVNDLDWQRRECALVQNDLDPTPSDPDGILDVVPVCGLGTLNRPTGGVLSLARGLQPSPATDPDLPATACNQTAAGAPSAFNPRVFPQATCFLIDPGFTYSFNSAGQPHPTNFGTYRVPAGASRTLVVGSPDAVPLSTNTDSILPPTEAWRFQTGANFDITDAIQLFGEVKYATETFESSFQPAFFNVGIRPFGATDTTTFTALNAFDIGLDNAYLDPALRATIQANQRATYDLRTTVNGQPNPNYGQQTGTVADPRALFLTFADELGGRPQINDREAARAVIGLRGDRDTLFGLINDFSWEIGYTYGQVEDHNQEPRTIDAERYAYAADAVRDVNNVTGRGANSIVCRVQLQAAQNGSVSIPTLGVTYGPNDPAVRDCVPIRIFGGGIGSGSISPEAMNYIITEQSSRNKFTQQDALAFASGELWDLWGAGPIGIAIGAEYREESVEGEFDSPMEDENDPNYRSLLFANLSPDFPRVEFNVKEVFGEIRIPILRDLPLAETLEISGAYRYSDYSTAVDKSESYNVQASWRPVRDILFRATYGRAVRAPNLVELFSPPSQTFLQITDPCSRPVIDTTANAQLRANRIANCAAQGVPADYVDPNPGSSNSGFGGSNPNLQEEVADSYTASVVLTPRFIPRFSMVLDWFDINIKQAITSVSLANILAGCYDIAVPAPGLCAALTRDPQTFEITNFVFGPVNFAGLRARGIDFAARYRIDLADMPFLDGDLGRLDFSLRGTYSIRRQDFVNPIAPDIATEIDATVRNPRVRYLFGTTWSWRDLGLTWEVDWQSSQEITDLRNALSDPDNRDPALRSTGAFTTHDFSARYDVNENIRLRAGVINAFDAEPNVQTGQVETFDLFGRRFYLGLTYRR